MFNSCFVCIYLLVKYIMLNCFGEQKSLAIQSRCVPNVLSPFELVLINHIFLSNSPYTCHNRLDLSFAFINFGCFILQVLAIDQVLLLAGILSEIHRLDLVQNLTALKWINQPIHMNFDILANSFSVLII